MSTRVDPTTGAILESAELSAIALCDEIEYYSHLLKLMSMSETDTGHMILAYFMVDTYPAASGRLQSAQNPRFGSLTTTFTA